MNGSLRSKICFGGMVLTMALAGRISAAEMNLDTVFTDGSVPPFNAATPWLEYRLDNLGANSVQFTLTATASMTGAEKISGFYFNFDDSLALSSLAFSAPTVNSGTFTLPTLDKGLNAYKAGGDGRFDLRLNFDTSGGLAAYFGAGDSISYLLTYTGSGTMTDASFAFLSQPSGGWGPYYAAAHIQATPNGGAGSAWLAATTVSFTPVPEPATAAMLIAGLVFLGMRRKAN